MESSFTRNGAIDARVAQTLYGEHRYAIHPIVAGGRVLSYAVCYVSAHCYNDAIERAIAALSGYKHLNLHAIELSA